MRLAASTIAALALAVAPASAAPGGLDPSGTGSDEVTALAAQGDRIVAAGSIYASLGLARYTTR